MTESQLKHLRGLPQFERCWGVIDSHLKLYERFNAVSTALADSIKQRAKAKEG